MGKLLRIGWVALLFLVVISGLFGQGASGIYETDFGEMTIQQNGSSVTGSYVTGSGKIEATLSGRTLSGWWYQANGKGRLVFVFSEDFSSFTGKWGYDSAEPARV